MKTLLTTLNAKYIHSNLALKYLYAAAGECRKTISINEFTINNDDDYIFTELLRGDYAVVCCSCYIWNIDRTLYLIENLKKANPKVTIVLGGPEVSFDPVSVMKKNQFVDFIISGEGEVAFKQLMDHFLTASDDYADVKGLTYWKDGELITNDSNGVIDFNLVPFPYDYLVCEEDKVIYYESVRGCPYRCSYCLSAIDKTIRALPLERVKKELSYFIYKKVKQVKFIDRTFNWDKGRCFEILKFLIDNDNGITNFHFEMCGDTIDEELINLLKTAREDLFQLEIGIQSTNKTTLEACNRHSDFSRLEQNVRQIMEQGNVHIHLDLIAGLPYEDYESFRLSFNQVYALSAPQLQLGFLKLLKGSHLRGQAADYGYVFRQKPPYEVISNHFMSPTDLVKLKMTETVLDLYYNRGGFELSIEFAMAVLDQTSFDFYEGLASYYFEKGFQHRSHKKEDLYRIFLQYISLKEKTQEGTVARIKELLEEDMKRTLNPDAIKKFERKGWNIQ